MMVELFYSCREQAWPASLRILTDHNLRALVQHLHAPPAEDVAAGQLWMKVPCAEGHRRSHKSFPGLARQGHQYAGKIAFSNCIVKSMPTSIEEALDARIALGNLKQMITKLTEKGQSFDDAFLEGVAQ